MYFDMCVSETDREMGDWWERVQDWLKLVLFHYKNFF